MPLAPDLVQLHCQGNLQHDEHAGTDPMKDAAKDSGTRVSSVDP
jgi:hypothetical protein